MMKEIPMCELENANGFIRGTVIHIEDLPTVMIAGRFQDEKDEYLMPLDLNMDTDCLVKVFIHVAEALSYEKTFDNHGVLHQMDLMAISALNDIIQQQNELQDFLMRAERSRIILGNLMVGVNPYAK